LSPSTTVGCAWLRPGHLLTAAARLPVGILFLAILTGCGPSINRYALIDDSLRANDPKRADAIVEQAEKDYGSKSLVLYGMDRGMTLHLAGQYSQSNAVLEQAEEEIDKLYTRKIRTETAAFFSNDTVLPYEGDPYEQVMVNVMKALNYAVMGQIDEALVEARRLDNRLNVLGDRVTDKDGYRDDGFARYVSGILYETTGDLNNAFIAYRKASDAYDAIGGWARTPVPTALRSDLLRTAEALHFTTELDQYRQKYPETTWHPSHEQSQLAQVVVISYNGRAPQKEDQFFDLPLSLNAIQLVLLNRGLGGRSHDRREQRAADSVLYGLNGRVVRVALPRLILQKSAVAYDQIQLIAKNGGTVTSKTELVQNISSLAERRLSDQLPGITTKALARAAMKFAAAEAATRGAQAAAGKDHGAWVGLLVGLIAHGLAVASEEADKRSWRTLPDEIQLARLWVPPGDYDARISPVGRQGETPKGNAVHSLTLRAGQTTFLIERVMP
jgi:hypothetical protein